MAKIGRVTGPSHPDGTRPRVVERKAGVDLELLGPNADVTIGGNLDVTGSVNANGPLFVDGRPPVRVEALEHQPGVARWREHLALARSGSLSAIILIIGDSRVRSSATRYRNAWIDRLLRRFLGATPGSLGLLPASEGGLAAVTDEIWPGGDNPWTYAGSVTANVDYGLGFHAANIPSGGGSATITFFGDKITLFYVRTPTGPTAATVTIDGTSVGPLNANGALAAGQQTQYTAASGYGHHTLVVTPNSGTLIIEGVQWWDGDSPFLAVGTVQMFDASHAGFGASSWAGANNDWSAMLAGADVFFGGAVTVLDVNDIAGGRTPQQYEDDLVTIVNRIDARLGTTTLSWLFTILPTSVDTTGFLAAAYRARERVGLERASVYDMAALRPGRVWGASLSADGSHPNDAGHIWIAEALGQVLDPTPTTVSPTTPARQVIDASTPATARSSWTEAWTALTGGQGGYDQSGGGATVGERRHRIWLDPGTYRVTVTMQEDTGLGTTQCLLGHWVGNTPTLTSCGTKANAASSPTLVTTRLSTSVTTDVPGWCPLVIRKTSASGAIRFVQAVIDKTG